MATYIYGELLSKTTAHRVNPGEKANLSTEEFQSVKEGMIYSRKVQTSCYK